MTTADDELWAAVAEPSRRRLLDALLAAGPTTASALAEELPLTRQAIAKHLSVLEHVGLVTSLRAGREVRFSVEPARLSEASLALRDAGLRWEARLTAIKAIAERLAKDQQN